MQKYSIQKTLTKIDSKKMSGATENLHLYKLLLDGPYASNVQVKQWST